MSTTPDRLKYLLDQFATNELSETEFNELFSVIGQHETEVKKLLTEELDEQVPEGYDRIYWAKKFRQLNLSAKKAPVVRPMFWKKAAIAASIIFIIALGSYFVFFNKSKNQPPIASRPTDVEAPKQTRAMITLADGSRIYLDSTENGTIATQNNIQIIKSADGKLAYKAPLATHLPIAIGTPLTFNTLSNPRGSKVIDMTLSDGSHVWLNAGSSITYPVAFAGTERKVTITGEAYFDVAHNVKMPFRVNANGVLIEDLGTEFNVNAYNDEAFVRTTLISGIVRVGSVQLKPGQQALNDQLKGHVDIEEVTAWKNGKFQFNDASVETIMKEVGRWYDAEIVYENKVPGNFVAEISRDVPVSKLLHILELTNQVHFNIEGKKIIVKK